MRAPDNPENEPLFEYTLMPQHIRSPFSAEELQNIQLAEAFSFTKGCRTMKIAGRSWVDAHGFGSLLFDVEADPGQMNPLDDPAVEYVMIQHMARLMKANDSPPEQFERLGLQEHL